MRPTKPSKSQQSGKPFARISQLAILSLCVFASCTPSEPSGAESVSSGAVTTEPGSISPMEGWVKVSENPLTFFPEGLPKDADTTAASGDWVEAGPQNARWFIPREGYGGRTEQELFGEAFSMRTKSQNKEIARSNREAERRNRKSVYSPGAADYMALEMMRLHSQSTNFKQQSDQAWLDAH